jgi:two-component system, NarL family, nitrate/nitrite response regulator NarL
VGVAAAVRFYREGLAAVLDRQPEIRVVFETESADGLLEAATADVVLLDMSLPHAVEAVAALAGRDPAPNVLGIAMGDGEDEVVACAEAGIGGYVCRDDSLDALVEAVRGTARGEMHCPPRIAAALVHRVASMSERRSQRANGRPRLTRRESEIMALIDEGLSNKQIARRLCIELPTVKNHVHRILEKLGVDRRGEAVARMRAV